jgi:hypothetical protein
MPWRSIKQCVQADNLTCTQTLFLLKGCFKIYLFVSLKLRDSALPRV